MSKNNRLVRNLVLLCIMLITIIACGGLISHPASSQLSRQYNSEFDIRRIESRINQIENQLNQRGGTGSIRVPTPSVPSYNSGRYRQRLSSDPMFDRLATLAIELRERMDKLEARISKLESRVGAARTKR